MRDLKALSLKILFIWKGQSRHNADSATCWASYNNDPWPNTACIYLNFTLCVLKTLSKQCEVWRTKIEWKLNPWNRVQQVLTWCPSKMAIYKWTRPGDSLELRARQTELRLEWPKLTHRPWQSPQGGVSPSAVAEAQKRFSTLLVQATPKMLF